MCSTYVRERPWGIWNRHGRADSNLRVDDNEGEVVMPTAYDGPLVDMLVSL